MIPQSPFNLQNYQRVRILNKSHMWEIWPIWIIITYWFYKHSDTKTSKKLILGLFFSWISTFFFFCWKTHFLRWIVLKRSSIILLNVILAFWRMNVWGCNFQGNIIGRYWSGWYMTWPLWKSYNDIKKGNDFVLFMELQKLVFGLPKSIWTKCLPWISATGCWAAHLFWIAIIDREYEYKIVLKGEDSFLLFRKLSIIRRHFAWAYGT